MDDSIIVHFVNLFNISTTKCYAKNKLERLKQTFEQKKRGKTMSDWTPKFKVGQKIIRIVDGRAVNAGYEYKVVESDTFSAGNPQVVADGGFVIELLTQESEREYALAAQLDEHG